MGCTYAGPLGTGTNFPVVDPGTLCRQQSPPPSTLNGGVLLEPLAVPGPVLVGNAEREPGFNFDGSVAEDTLYGDKPGKSASITKDPVFALNDATLQAYMGALMESLSVGDMETVALEMHQRFIRGTGGTYRSALLDAKIANHSAFVEYHTQFIGRLVTALAHARYDPRDIPLLTMNLLDFSSFWDKATGLGITIHQVWSLKAELTNYRLDLVSGYWSADLVYTLYDHFGLDWEDILKNGKRLFPQYHTGDYFKAWYILQHYRTGRPFVTEMVRKVFIGGRRT